MPDAAGTPAAIAELVLPLLEQAQQAGLVGQRPLSGQIAHSLALSELVPISATRVADLGSGSGLPGLIVALARPDLEVALVEVSERRADFLRRAVSRLGLGARVRVDGRPAEEVGRDSGCRTSFDVVVARSFASPAVLAECAAPLLPLDGQLIVAEPPGDQGRRWDDLRDCDLPLALTEVVSGPGGTFARLTMTESCPSRFPRAAGVPFRRPLF